MHIEMLCQSHGIEENLKNLAGGNVDINFEFIEIPSGAGKNATQDRSKAAIFQTKSIITINNDDNSCSWHAMTVLLN